MFYLEKQTTILGNSSLTKMECQLSEKMDHIYTKNFSPRMDLTLRYIQWEVSMPMPKQENVQLWMELFKEILMEKR